jgi:alpha-glucosidase
MGVGREVLVVNSQSAIRNSEFLWWRDGVIYQIYPRSFADSNGDGVGDLPGILSRLDYLQWLGVDAIWLSPIYPSPMADWGYDVSNYHDIDPVFGALADFDRLVSQAHARGIRVVLDMVMNHTSDEHPWFVESRASRHNPKRNWYIWRDPRDGREPNNWESVFGGKAWQWDEPTGQYYLHLFHSKQPDLNWRNPLVKEAMFGECRFWLERGVDGFRFDVADMFFKAEGLPDNPPKFGLRGYDRLQHLYEVNQPETHALWQDLRKLLDAYPERMAVGEVDSDGAEDYYSSGDDELHLAFNFGLLHQNWHARSFYNVVNDWEARLPEGAWPCWVMGNHDVKRVAGRYASGAYTQARLRVAAALLLTLRGTPFIYYGEEIGMREGKIPRAEILDPPGKKYWPFYKGRDGCRTPMQWNAGLNAGFYLHPPAGAVSTARPWLRVNPDYRQLNIEAQQGDPKSLLNFYRDLIALRRQSPALVRGTYKPLGRPIDVWAFQREADGQRMLVALNFFSRPAQMPLSGPWRVRLSSVERAESDVSGVLALAPCEAVILESV